MLRARRSDLASSPSAAEECEPLTSTPAGGPAAAVEDDEDARDGGIGLESAAFLSAHVPAEDDDDDEVIPFSWLEYAIFGLLGVAMLWAW
ncbi:hypothetical protein AAL_02534 [Moelleriella libera RCEF 2490]|uniref:Uncharacterized protein n=1 Tax=Moelleriella libera RCEF 2490 TaxID=1081109 RepID=A0A168ENB3_9HYPO|nr:hypothetical protein AAL_02534 [Moelleriella libera RCEF 2490]